MWVSLENLKCDWFGEWFDWRKIDSRPIAFCRGGIGVSRSDDLRQTDHLFCVAAVVEQDAILRLHLAQKIARLKISNACPSAPAVGHEIGPCVRVRFLFNQPVMGSHAVEGSFLF